MQPPSDFSGSNQPFSGPPERPFETPQNPATQIAPPRGPVISFDVIGDSWTLFRSGMLVWIGASLLNLVVTSALTFWLLFTLPDPAKGRQFSPSFWLAIVFLGLFATFFHGAMFRVALGQIRSGRARFGDLWSSIATFPALLLVSFLEGLAIGVGSLFCLLPGLLLMALFLFAALLVVDPQRKMGAIGALSASYQALKSQMWMALVFALVVYLLANAGQILCGVGVVVTLPLFYLSIALAYRDFFLGDETPRLIRPVAPQAPPIADPFR